MKLNKKNLQQDNLKLEKRLQESKTKDRTDNF